MHRSIVKTLGLLTGAVLLVAFVAAGSTILKTVSRQLVVPVATTVAMAAKDGGPQSVGPPVGASAETVDHAATESVMGATSQSPSDTTAQDEEGTAAAGDDEKRRAGEERAPKKKTKEGTLSIKIDESGIRVEGTEIGDDLSDSTGHRIIFDSGDWTVGGRGTYRERGTDIVKFGEDVRVDADELVRGDVVVFGGDVSVAGKVVGNVVVFGGDAMMRSGAEINGDVVVLAGELEEEPEVLIHGERVRFKHLNLSLASFPFFFDRGARLFDVFFIPVQFFISVVLSFLIILFLRGRVVRSQEHITSGPFKSLGAGFLVAFIGLFVVSFLTIILLITLIGIPLAFVLIVSCIAVFIIADTVFVYAHGSKINDKLNIQTENPFGIVLMGTAVLYLPALLGFAFSLLPFGGPLGATFKFFGWMLGVFAFLAGLGALFLSRFGTRHARVEAPVTVPAGPE